MREPHQIRKDCATQLREVQVSDRLQAILGCLLGEDSTSPRLPNWLSLPTVTYSIINLG
jgi:hypothetical protein